MQHPLSTIMLYQPLVVWPTKEYSWLKVGLVLSRFIYEVLWNFPQPPYNSNSVSIEREVERKGQDE